MSPSARNRIVLAVLALVVLGAGAAFFLKRGPGLKVVTGKVVRGSLDASVSATGTVNPVVTVHVGSQVSGTVLKLYADYNTEVRKGQLLLELDPAIYRAQMAQARANLEKAQSDALNAQRNWDRAKQMFDRNFSSQADRDLAQTTYESATSTVKQMKAAVDLAQVNVDHCTITSPINGTVISRSVDVGQTVAASLQAPELFVIANDLTRMQVETAIDEADVGKIQNAQPVTFTVDAYPDRTFHGSVTQIRAQPVTVSNVVTYTTVIEVSNPDEKLKPGMTANVTILVAHRDDVLKIPNGALRYRPTAEIARKFGFKLEDFARGSGGGNLAGASTDTSHAHGMGRRHMGAGADSSHGHWGGAPGGSGHSAGGNGGGNAAGAGGTGASGGFGAARKNRTPPAKAYVLDSPTTMHAVTLRAGLSDGSFTEILDGDLKEGQDVVTSVSAPGSGARAGTTTPPGFGGPGGQGGGGGGRGR